MSSSVNYEVALLGCMLSDSTIANAAVSTVKSKHFTTEKNQAIYEAIAECSARGQVDLVLVVEEMKQRGTLDRVGGEKALSEILSSAGVSSHWKWYAKNLLIADLEKRQIRECYRFKQNIKFDDVGEHITNIAKMQEEKEALSREEKTLADIHGKAMASVSSPANIITLGFPTLDRASFRLGENLFIAARPEVGKSLLAINILQYQLEQKAKCLVYTTEMTQEEYYLRQVSLYSGIPYYNVRNNYLTAKEKALFTSAGEEFISRYKDNIVFSNHLRPTSQQIAAEVEKTMPRVVLLDNLSNVRLGGSSNEKKADLIGEFIREIREACQKANAFLIVIVHINRLAEGFRETKPNIFNLKDSGQIEELANKVLLLWADREQHDYERKLVYWSMGKNRDAFGDGGVLVLDRRTLKMTEQ